MLTQKAALYKDKLGVGNATFEHRHFAALAGMIAAHPSPTMRDEMARYLSVELANTNPRFDRARFMRACGYDT